MRGPGVPLGVGVAAGVALSLSVLPLDPHTAAGAALAACGAALAHRGAWILVPVGLGLFRAAVAVEEHDAARVIRPLAISGPIAVAAPAGRDLLLEAGKRRLLLRRPPAGFAVPGQEIHGLLRADPLRSRADPSAFRANRWGAIAGVDGRATLLESEGDARAAPGALPAARRAAGAVRLRAQERLSGTADAPSLLRALLLGDRSGLATDARDAFRRAGLAHVLALSGLHTGILAIALASLLRCSGIPRGATAGSTILFLAGFAFLTGARAPILRACGTASLALLAAACGRRPAPLHALGLVGAALLLARPLLWTDTGFRLSFLAAGLLALAATRRARRARPPGHALRAVEISGAITLGTLPEIARSFGRVSLLSPLTNLLAGPLAALALGWSALAAALPWEQPGHILFRAAQRAAEALLALARAAGSLPGGEIACRALPAGTSALAVAAAACAAARRGPPRAARGPLALLAAASTLALFPVERLTVLDVGQGNALLVEGRPGAVLLDGGPPARGGGDSAAFAAARWRGRRELRAAVLTHGHADHAGGLEDFFRGGVVERLLLPARSGASPSAVAALLELAADSGTVLQRADGSELPLLPGRLRVFSPWPEGIAPRGTDENDLSLCARWSAGRAGALLTGDLGRDGERALLERGDLAAPVLLAGHHGSRTSTSRALLDAVRPSLILVSCGAGNAHGHPHAEVLSRAAALGAGLLRTDRDGSVRLTATPRGFRVRWERAFPGPRSLFPAIPLCGTAPVP